MNRGMQAVLDKLDGIPNGDIGAMLKTVGMTLVSTVGGAGGPLYGTLFLQFGAATAGKAEIEPADWALALEKGVEGVQMRGKAEPGDKTMVDALIRARDAFRRAVDEGESFPGVQTRIATVLERIARRHNKPRDIVAVVFHADPIKLVVAHFLGLPLDHFQRLSCDTGSLTALYVGEMGANLIKLNRLG